jgi:hypothetical protein
MGINMKKITAKEKKLITTENIYTYDLIIPSQDNKSETIHLEIQENMDYETLIAISDKIADVVVTEEQYKPEYKKPLYLYYVLDNMSNYKPLQTSNELNINEMFKLLNSPIGQKIDEVICEIPTLKELNEMINEKIAYKKEVLLHKSSLDELFKSLNSLLITINEKARRLDIDHLENLIKNLKPKEILKTT